MNTAHDPLENLLKADALAMREGYIDDAGFTKRVVAAMPAHSRLSRAARIGVPLAFTLVASTVVMCCTAAGSLAVDAFMDLATETVTANAVGLLLVTAVVIGVSTSNLTGDA